MKFDNCEIYLSIVYEKLKIKMDFYDKIYTIIIIIFSIKIFGYEIYTFNWLWYNRKISNYCHKVLIYIKIIMQLA